MLVVGSFGTGLRMRRRSNVSCRWPKESNTSALFGFSCTWFSHDHRKPSPSPLLMMLIFGFDFFFLSFMYFNIYEFVVVFSHIPIWLGFRLLVLKRDAVYVVFSHFLWLFSSFRSHFFFLSSCILVKLYGVILLLMVASIILGCILSWLHLHSTFTYLIFIRCNEVLVVCLVYVFQLSLNLLWVWFVII
jgi:hypothetical protein